MKNLLLTILLSFSVSLVFAQDTITKRNSEIVIAKILEINPTEIKYKKFNFQDGPTYTEKRSDIKMILYSNGAKEIFEPEQPKKIEVQIPDNVDYYGETSASSNKIEILGKVKFRQKGLILNERKLQNVLIQTKDKKIVALVRDAKTAKAMQYIGFAAIPLGIVAIITYNEGMLAGGAVCLVAAVACPIASGVFKKNRISYNKAAVKLYNEKF